jgi:hypothetical protein
VISLIIKGNRTIQTTVTGLTKELSFLVRNYSMPVLRMGLKILTLSYFQLNLRLWSEKCIFQGWLSIRSPLNSLNIWMNNYDGI